GGHDSSARGRPADRAVEDSTGAAAADRKPVPVRRRRGLAGQAVTQGGPAAPRGRGSAASQGRTRRDGRGPAWPRVLRRAGQPPGAGGRGMSGDVVQIAIGALQGLGASTVFVLVLFIGFCVVFGFTKTKR